MRKTFLGLAVVTAIATPLAFASSASADVISADSSCTPVKHVDAYNETLYKYTPLKSSDGPTQWDTKNASAGTTKTWLVKGKSVTYFRDGTKTSTVAHPAVEGVTCAVTLPEHLVGEGTYSVVVPYVKGVDTFLLGVEGYDEKVAITKDVTVTRAMAGQFWIGHQAQEGYVIANPTEAQWHIDFQFATGPNDVRLTDAASSSKHIPLPDEFLTEHSADGFPGYYSTQVRVAIINDTDIDKSVNVMYADQQDANRVWIERGVFENWTNSTTIPAHATRYFTFDVWHDAPVGSPTDVPDDLTLDFDVFATNA